MTTLSDLDGLGAYQQGVQDALADLEAQRSLPRIWAKDHTVWRPDPKEIANRLGWLDVAQRMQAEIPRLEALRDALLDEGYTHVLLLGMGGSSLSPEVFSKVFGGQGRGLSLKVLDSTDPGAVLACMQALPLRHTVLIVATKSGGTVETFSFFRFFYNHMLQLVDGEVGDHFIAITDPGSTLALLAEEYGFRECFLNDPTIGGRSSALSFFGLVPAALVGVDLSRLLARAGAMMESCGPLIPAAENPAACLGAVMGELAKTGRDKLTLVTSPAIGSFGDWVEQLVAESTGKEGKGILPVVGEPVGAPECYGSDRLFVHLALAEDASQKAALDALVQAGHPVVALSLADRYDLGGQFFLWELATAVAGARLGIQPFDQPNVEAAKRVAREMVAAYERQGVLPEVETAPLTGAALTAFLAQGKPGDYVAIQAYVTPTPEADAALRTLRLHIWERTRLATTVGYGPRFLHSTGQLHKGDGGNGLFIQLTSEAVQDLPIPDAAGDSASSISFGVLKAAQSLGDRQALLDAGRRVIRFNVGTDAVAGIRSLTAF